MKSKRQEEILRLIGEQDIETQEQMLEGLRACGIRATQATISRDIKELNLVKQPAGNGVYRYVVSQTARQPHHNYAGRLHNIFCQGVTSFDYAQNIVVVKTMPGLASAVGAALDGMEIEGMVGTIAGDDTGLIIMRDNASAQHFSSEIHNLLR